MSFQNGSIAASYILDISWSEYFFTKVVPCDCAVAWPSYIRSKLGVSTMRELVDYSNSWISAGLNLGVRNELRVVEATVRLDDVSAIRMRQGTGPALLPFEYSGLGSHRLSAASKESVPSRWAGATQPH